MQFLICSTAFRLFFSNLSISKIDLNSGGAVTMTRIRSHPVAKLLRSHSGNDIQWVKAAGTRWSQVHGLAAAGDSARDGHSSSLTTLTPRPAGGPGPP
jgi:hypothetical protein